MLIPVHFCRYLTQFISYQLYAYILIAFISFSGGVFAEDIDEGPFIAKGYRDQLYVLKGENPQEICEYDLRFNEMWCFENSDQSMGLYLGFKQLLVYSKKSIQGINRFTKKIKWTIPLEGIHKVHINYPVIVTFSKQKVLKGYDFFTGFQLWEKQTDYLSFYESGIDLWMVSKTAIDKIDVISSDVVSSIPFKKQIRNIVGNDINLFVKSKKKLIFLNSIDSSQDVIGSMSVQDVSSEFLLIGDKKAQQLRTFDNKIVSDNVMEDLFLVDTPTRKYFAYIRNDKIYVIKGADEMVYKFTTDKRNDKIKYAYKLKGFMHVFYEDDRAIWTLEQINNKTLSDQDT